MQKSDEDIGLAPNSEFACNTVDQIYGDLNFGDCSLDCCAIDTYYSNQLYDFFVQNPNYIFTTPSVAQCQKIGGINSPANSYRYCVGQAPFLHTIRMGTSVHAQCSDVDANGDCIQCEEGYRLEGADCLLNICLCDNGTPKDTCDTNGQEICKSCNVGWTLNTQTQLCVENQCTCSNGLAAGTSSHQIAKNAVTGVALRSGNIENIKYWPNYDLTFDVEWEELGTKFSNMLNFFMVPILYLDTRNGGKATRIRTLGFQNGQLQQYNVNFIGFGQAAVGQTFKWRFVQRKEDLLIYVDDQLYLNATGLAKYHSSEYWGTYRTLLSDAGTTSGTDPNYDDIDMVGYLKNIEYKQLDVDTYCDVDGAEVCQSCDDGYYLEGAVCVANVCVCDNGTPVDSGSASCLNNGEQVCQSCDIGWTLDSDSASCVQNSCTCDGGIAAGPANYQRIGPYDANQQSVAAGDVRLWQNFELSFNVNFKNFGNTVGPDSRFFALGFCGSHGRFPEFWIRQGQYLFFSTIASAYGFGGQKNYQVSIANLNLNQTYNIKIVNNVNAAAPQMTAYLDDVWWFQRNDIFTVPYEYNNPSYLFADRGAYHGVGDPGNICLANGQQQANGLEAEISEINYKQLDVANYCTGDGLAICQGCYSGYTLVGNECLPDNVCTEPISPFNIETPDCSLESSTEYFLSDCNRNTTGSKRAATHLGDMMHDQMFLDSFPYTDGTGTVFSLVDDDDAPSCTSYSPTLELHKTTTTTGGQNFFGFQHNSGYANKNITISFNYKWVDMEAPDRQTLAGNAGLIHFYTTDNTWFDDDSCTNNWCTYQKNLIVPNIETEATLNNGGQPFRNDHIWLNFNGVPSEVKIRVNNFLIYSHECVCENGTPVSSTDPLCLTPGTDVCETCNNGYELNNDNHCEPMPSSDAFCDTIDVNNNVCQQCDNTHVLNSNTGVCMPDMCFGNENQHVEPLDCSAFDSNTMFAFDDCNRGTNYGSNFYTYLGEQMTVINDDAPSCSSWATTFEFQKQLDYMWYFQWFGFYNVPDFAPEGTNITVSFNYKWVNNRPATVAGNVGLKMFGYVFKRYWWVNDDCVDNWCHYSVNLDVPANYED